MDPDFTLIQQAAYTEPDDQSAWLYHRWLLLTTKQRTQPLTLSNALRAPIVFLHVGTSRIYFLSNQSTFCA
jgi:hypothetical protein